MHLLPRHLNTRLIVLVSCSLVITGVTSGWLTARKQSNMLLASMRGNSAVMTASFSDNAAHYLVLRDYAGLKSLLLTSAELPDILRLQVCEPDGSVIGDVERAPGRRPRPFPGVKSILPPPPGSGLIYLENGGMVIWAPIEAGTRLGWLKATFSMASIREAQAEAWENSVLFSLFWGLCNVLLLIVVMRPTIRTIGRLTAFARNLDEHKGDQIEAGRQAIEIEELGASLNYASRRLFSTEQQLLHEWERLRVTLGSIYDGVIAADARGMVVFMNGSSEELTGWTAQEAAGRNVAEVFSLASPEAETFFAAVSAGRPVADLSADARLRMREGRELHVAGSAAPIRDDLGQMSGMVIVFRDISKQRLAERTLALLNFALNNVRDEAFLINEHARFDYVNDQSCRALGYLREEFFDLSVADVDPDFPPDRWTEHWRELQRLGSSTFEGRHRTRDGRIYPVEISANYFEFDGKGYNLALARDITERRQAVEALRRSEEKYRTIFEESFDGLFITSPAGKIVDINRKGVALFGYGSKEEIQSLDLARDIYANPADRKRILDMVNAQGTAEYEVEVRKKTGETMTAQCALTAVKDAAGRTLSYRGIIRDITERKRAEEALRRLNRELRAISNCNQVLVRAEDEKTLLNDICGIICEEAGYRMAWVGYAEHDEARSVRIAAQAGFDNGYLAAAGITWGDEPRGRGSTGTALRNGMTDCIQDFAMDPKAAPWRENALQRGYRSSIALPLKDEAKTTFGALTIYSTESNAFTPDETRLLEELAGDLAYGIVVLRARIERRRAEDYLQEREAFIRNILESVDEGFIVVDRQYRILSANRAFCDLMKLPEDRVVGRTCYEITHQLDRPCFEAGEECAVRRTFETGTSHNVIHTHGQTAGGKRFVDIKSYPIIDASGTVVSAIETVNDITERRRLEEQLRQAQKMEAVGTLAGGVAHDFNNILTAIIGYGSLAKMRLKPDDPLQATFDQILSSSERAAHLTQGLLSFSRKQIINPKPVDLNDVVRNVEKLLRRLIGEDIALSTELAAGKLISLADPGHVEQVLMNLATNARDAMPDGGTLSITTQEIDLRADFVALHGFGGPGRHCLITVSDTGLGMDDRTRDKIFEPFFTTKEVGKGTGLGLAIVYGIIKQHNGTIHVYSEPGKGTTFKIYLPLLDAQLRETSPEATAPPRGGTETILIAEDDANVRTLTSTVLREFGYRVIEAVDGLDALIKFEQEGTGIDLVVLDVIMPGRSGKEVYDAIRQVRPDLAVLFISGYTADIIQKKGIAGQGLQFLSKPISPFDLLGKIRDMLDGRPHAG